MKSKVILSGIVASCVAAQFASSQTITQTIPFSYIPNGSQTLVFDQYSGGATLQNIEIILSITKTGGSLFVDNESATPASGSISQTVEADLSSPDVFLFQNAAPSNAVGQNLQAVSTYVASVAAHDGDNVNQFDPGGADVDGTTFTTPVNNGTSGFVHSNWWAEYIGAGTFDINVDGSQFTNTSAIGGASTSTSPATLSGTVTVIYTIPEPSAALLGGLGLLALIRRRR